MITGRKYWQLVTASVSDGNWVATIKGQIWTATDGEEWVSKTEFECTGFGDSYEEAFGQAVEETALYLVEVNEEEEADGQPISEDNTPS